jgi:magnesium transporter
MYELVRVENDKVKIDGIDSLGGLKLDSDVTWIHVNARTEAELSEITDLFSLHKLTIEDCVDRRQRPKVEVFDEYILITLKQLELKSTIVANHLAIIIGKKYLITVSNKMPGEIAMVMEDLKAGKIMRKQSDSIAYRILDRVVDSYFPILDQIEDDIEIVEKSATKKTDGKKIAEKIFETRRKLLALRKATWPARDLFSTLSKGDLPLISKKNQIYYRDVYDHVVLIIDLVETYRELVSGILETHLSAVSNSLNEVMKVLTVISTIFIPLTFITGLYGMNFEFMPELQWEYSYGAVLLLMMIISGGMLFFFKRRGWL